MKFAVVASIALGVCTLLSASVEAQSIQNPILLRCPSVGSGYVLNIKIQGQNIWVADRPQNSIFSETEIQFTDDAMPGFFHILDRTNGRLTIYNKEREIDSVYNCRVVDKVMF
jgi:hypothetical protein